MKKEDWLLDRKIGEDMPMVVCILMFCLVIYIVVAMCASVHQQSKIIPVNLDYQKTFQPNRNMP